MAKAKTEKKEVAKKDLNAPKKPRKAREKMNYGARLVKRLNGFGAVLGRLADQAKRTKNDKVKEAGEALTVAVEALNAALEAAKAVPDDFQRSGGTGGGAGAWVPAVGATVTWAESKKELYRFLSADSITVDAVHGDGRNMRCQVTVRAKGQPKQPMVIPRADLQAA